MRAADETAGRLAVDLAQRPPEELRRILEGIKEIYDREGDCATVVNVQVRLDDQQSRTYEVIKLISGIDEKNGAIRTAFLDGIVLEQYVLLTALNAALLYMGLAGEEEDEDGSGQKD